MAASRTEYKMAVKYGTLIGQDINCGHFES